MHSSSEVGTDRKRQQRYRHVHDAGEEVNVEGRSRAELTTHRNLNVVVTTIARRDHASFGDFVDLDGNTGTLRERGRRAS